MWRPRGFSVAVIDGDPCARDHVADVVRSAEGLTLCGVATTVPDGLELLRQGPDLLITDLELRDGDGLSLIHAARAQEPTPKILCLSGSGDEVTAWTALWAGADGYLLKSDLRGDLLGHICDVMSEGSPISPSVAAHVLRRLRRSTLQAGPCPLLSPREVELLGLLSRGLTNKEAALRLGLSPFTVGDYIKAVYRKLNVNSRGEAVFEAISRRLISL